MDARSAPRLNWTDLPEAAVRSAANSSKRLSTAHKSQFRPNTRIGGWAGCDRKKVIHLRDVPEHDALESEYDSDDFASDLSGEGGVGEVHGHRQLGQVIGIAVTGEKFAQDAAPGAAAEVEDEWEQCDVSSIGGASWLEVDSASLFDEVLSVADDDDRRSVCSDMSFVMVDNAPGEGDADQAAAAVGGSWAARLNQSNPARQPHRHVQPRRFPIAAVPVKKKSAPKTCNGEDINDELSELGYDPSDTSGFGIREATRSRNRRQQKGR
mmetsp:Transcript_52314/g.124849  ORF Transcript_52314/g.124849 Transcript_52314/m.124849 type:complete len:267 (-) Transcript_52314:210-1010(-)